MVVGDNKTNLHIYLSTYLPTCFNACLPACLPDRHGSLSYFLTRLLGFAGVGKCEIYTRGKWKECRCGGRRGAKGIGRESRKMCSMRNQRQEERQRVDFCMCEDERRKKFFVCGKIREREREQWSR